MILFLSCYCIHQNRSCSPCCCCCCCYCWAARSQWWKSPPPLQSWCLSRRRKSWRKFALVNIIYSLSFRPLLIPLVFRNLSVTWHAASGAEKDVEMRRTLSLRESERASESCRLSRVINYNYSSYCTQIYYCVYALLIQHNPPTRQSRECVCVCVYVSLFFYSPLMK